MKAQQMSSDIITTLPQTIIESILCLLPIKQAARTSILSREWRYKWTTIPKLVFDRSTVYKRTTKEKQTSDMESARKNMDMRCKLFYVIYQVLLLHQGPIEEFTLSMYSDFHCFEIDQIILYLSRNHNIKKLKLDFEDMYKLPVCTFSLHQLTDLYLSHIDLEHLPIFSGFGSLRSLCLDNVVISTKVLLHLLSNCPSLKSFSLYTDLDHYDKDCTIIELFECLPMIEDLTTYRDIVDLVDLDSLPEELPTSLIHLKYFCFEDICIAYVRDLTFLAILIKCSPNLEHIRIEIHEDHSFCEEAISSAILEKYTDIWLEHLNELEIKFFRNSKSEMQFVKFILTRSPKLKKVRISGIVKTEQEKFEISKILLRTPRASPVEIYLELCIF